MWSLAGIEAFEHLICCFGPGSHLAGWSTALGQLLSTRPEWQGASWSAALGLSCAASRSATLGLCVGQLASAPGVHPPEVSGVGAPPGFQVWAPSLLIWVCATGLQVSAKSAYPMFTVQGLMGEGRQRPPLLQRVL